MPRLRALSLLCLVLSASGAIAQSADQEVVSVVDAPDPVTPGTALSYTVTVTNHGPNAATNGGVNINLPLAVTHSNDAVPAGWACFWAGNNGTCNTPSFAVGTEVLTINVIVGAHLAAFPDQDISANFFPSGTTPDPNAGNNSKSVTTTVDSPQVDLSLTATDSPDPVFPDGNVTYTVTVTNGGPDTASNVNFNVVPNSSLTFQSATIPAGWNCTLPAVGAVNATFTCSRASWAPGTDQFTVVFSANDEQFGINDTTFQTNFNVGAGASNETDPSGNSQTITTTYTTPDADVNVSVSDSPDPVFPDGNITYTVTVGNAGPDTAPNVTLSSFGSNNLRFVSATVPAGWNCTLPAPGAQTAGFSCTLAAGLVSGDSDVLTFVLQAADELNGINDGTILFGFSANSSIADPDADDNSETESTQYTTPDADVAVSATDAPDPVAPDGDITYTVTVSNAGPDSTAATLAVPMDGRLKFTSIAVPAGFSCTGIPAVGTATSFSCTNPSFAPGEATFTVVLNADANAFANVDQTIEQNFSVTGSVSDPASANNSVDVLTTYDVPDADLSVSASDAPDPVAAGATVTYTVALNNAGPDGADNVSLVMPLASGLLFQSLTAPAGFSCTTPAVGATGTTTCTTATFANGANVPFTLVATVDPALNSGPDGTIEQHFQVSSTTNDVDPADNETSTITAYTTPDADISVTASDAPDPVTAGNTITYTTTITNNGPDTADAATFTLTVPASLGFQSIAAPAGWSCISPAVGSSGPVQCSAASMPSGETASFTLLATAEGPSASATLTVNGDSDTFDPDGTDNAATTTTTILAPQADLAITKDTASTTAEAGSTVSYTVVVTNGGPHEAQTVVMSDTLPPDLLFTSLSAPPGWNCTSPAAGSGGTITCDVAALANGAAGTFTIVTTVASGATAGTIITNSASISATTADPDGGDDSDDAPPVTVTPPPSADLSVSKLTMTTEAAAGATFDYTITVTNNGPDTADDAVLTDVLPPELLFRSMVAPAPWSCVTPSVGANGTVTCTAASLAVGVTSTFLLTVEVDSTASAGTVTNTASASSSTDDPNAANSSDSAPPVTVVPIPSADLAVAKTTTATEVIDGETFDYTISVTNNGPDAAASVVLTDTLPAQLLFRAITVPAAWTCSTPAIGASGTITCSTDPLNNGATATLTLSVEANGTSGSVTNTASVSSATADPNAGNSTGSASAVTLAPPPSADLAVTKTTTATEAIDGETFDYTISVTNNGPDAAASVVLTDTLPAQLFFRAITIPAGWTCSTPAIGASGTITCSTDPLNNGVTATFTLTVEANGTSGSVTNSASVSSATADPNAGNSTGSASAVTLAPPPSADLAITKTTTTTEVIDGETFDYTISVTNNGPDAAASVVLTDTLPAQLLFRAITVPAGWTCSTPAIGASGTITCSTDPLNNGATATLTLTVEANGTSGSVTNSASVSSATADPNAGNSTGSASAVTLAPPPSADLAITKTTTTTEVIDGETFDYTISVTNNGPDAAASVVLTDTLPAQLLFRAITLPAGWTCSTPAIGASGTITCSTDPLNNGVPATFTLTVEANGTSGSVTNSASVSSATDDPNAGNSTGTASAVTLAPALSADLAVTKTTTATDVRGEEFDYTITVTNNGPDAASSVELTDVLPPELLFSAISAPAGWTCSTPSVGMAGTVTCTVALLGNGAVSTFTLTVEPWAVSGSVTNAASASSSTADPNAGNSSASAPPVTFLPPPIADLGVEKTTTATIAPEGSQFDYTIVVTNAGPDAAEEVIMRDTLPANVTFTSIAAPSGWSCTTPAMGSTGTITCTVASFASGATGTFTLTVEADAPSGIATNTAMVFAPATDPDSSNSSDSASDVTLGPASAGLSITKTTMSSSAITGATLVYTISIANAGPSAATDVLVTDAIPASLELLSATASQGTCSGTTTVTCEVGVLAPGAGATITLQTRVVGTSGTVSNTATVTAAENVAGVSASTAPIPVTAPAATQIPTLSEWALLLMAAAFGFAAVVRIR